VWFFYSTMTGTAAAEVAPLVERLARVGYAAKALLYFTIGLLAAQAGLGRGGRTTDTHGALRVVHGVTFGRGLLLVVAAGLIGYSVWRLIEAIIDPERRGTDLKAVLLRASFAVRGLFYAVLAWTAFRLATGNRSAGAGNQAKDWTARAFELAGGELLVWVAAAGMTGYGLYQLFRAYTAKLSRQLDLSELSARAVRSVVAVSRFGLAARGVVFCLIGYLLGRAAAGHDPAQAGGIQKSLGLLAQIGRWPFIVVALGLVAYGAYEVVNARYRRIRIRNTQPPLFQGKRGVVGG
jgi:uncharacterized protein DUF1206